MAPRTSATGINIFCRLCNTFDCMLSEIYRPQEARHIGGRYATQVNQNSEK